LGKALEKKRKSYQTNIGGKTTPKEEGNPAREENERGKDRK